MRHVSVLATARSYSFGTTGVLPLCWLAKLRAGVGIDGLVAHASCCGEASELILGVPPLPNRLVDDGMRARLGSSSTDELR